MGGVISSFSSSSGENSITARQALEKKLADREEIVSVLSKDLSKDLSKKESECTTVYQDVENLRGKIKELEAQSSSALDETHACDDISSKQLRATKSAQELNAAKAELTALEDKSKTLEQEKKVIIDRLDGLKAELAEAKEAHEALGPALNKEIATYKAQITEAEVKNQNLQQTNDKLEANLIVAATTLDEQKRVLAESKDQYATLQQSLDKLKEEFKAQFSYVKSGLARTEERAVALQQSHDKLRTDSESELASLKSQLSELAQLPTKHFALEQTNQVLEKELVGLKEKKFAALEQSNWGLKSDSAELVAAKKEASERQENHGALRTTHYGLSKGLEAVEEQAETAQASTTKVEEDLKASQEEKEALEAKIASLESDAQDSKEFESGLERPRGAPLETCKA